MKRTLVVISILVTTFISLGQTNPYAYSPAQIKQLLPEPVVSDRPEWIDLYWKTWELFANHIMAAPQGSRFVPYFMDEAFDANYVFLWDTAFMTMFARFGFKHFPTIVSFDNFYCVQESTGRISREPNVNTGIAHCTDGCENDNNPPLFAWAEWQHFQMTADTARFSKQIAGWKDGKTLSVYQRMVNHYSWIEKNMASSIGLFWNTGMGSGMDNTPRTGSSWICMSAQMAMNAYYLAKISGVMGNSVAEAEFQAKHQALKQKINQYMWDGQDRFYYDINGAGNFSRVKTPASAWPLIANVADSAHAAGVVAHLTNPNEFWRTQVFPSLTPDHEKYDPNGGYWQGSVWPPTTYQAIKGLAEYGYDSIARLATIKDIQNISDVYKNTGTLWECYAPDFVRQGNEAAKDFVGWTGCAPISLLIENYIGINVHAPENTVEWKLTLLSKNGIRNLQFRDNAVSLVCANRNKSSDAPNITVTALKPFVLTVFSNGLRYSRQFGVGSSTWVVGTSTAVHQKIRGAHSNNLTQSDLHSLIVGASSDRSVEIINAIGAVIWSSRGAQSHSYLPNRLILHPGIYVVRVVTSAGQSSRRMRVF